MKVPNNLAARIHKHLKARDIAPILRPYYVEAVARCAVGKYGSTVYSMGAACSPLFAAGSAVNCLQLHPFVRELVRKQALDCEASIP